MKRLSVVFASLVTVLFSATAFAEEAAGGAAAGAAASSAPFAPGDKGWIAIATGLALGLAALGGTFSQGKTAAAAVEGLARNPSVGGRLIVPMILGLAFIESLFLFTWVGMLFIL